MQKKATRSEILMLSGILERIGMEETLRAVQFAAEWNAEAAAELAETNSGTAQQTFAELFRLKDSPSMQQKYTYGS